MVELTQQDLAYKTVGEASINAGFNLASSLQIRLDTSSVVRQIEMYLKGIREEIVQDATTGQIFSKQVWKGEPMVNDEGLQGIMSFIEIIFNPQVVQGNFLDYDMYADYLCRTRKDLADHLMKNFYNYEINEDKFNGIISTVMRFIEAFMSRLIFNEERKSYAQTIKSVESTTNQPTKTGFKLLPW